MLNYDDLSKRIESLAKAEQVSKELLMPLSRDLLQFLVDTGDIRPVNQIIADGVLSSINRRTARNYFRAFCPFDNIMSADGKYLVAFGKMKGSKKDKKFELIREFLSDPHNNIFTWSNANEDVIVREWKIEKVTKIIERAKKEGFGEGAIVEAIMAGGISAKDIIALVGKLAEAEEEAPPVEEALM